MPEKWPHRIAPMLDKIDRPGGKYPGGQFIPSFAILLGFGALTCC